MALANNRTEREKDKFVLSGTDTAVRIVGVSSVGSSVSSNSKGVNEKEKFLLNSGGDTSVRIIAT